MALFSSITAGVGVAKGIISPISSLFGGSSCTAQQKQQKKEIEEAIRLYLSPGDMRNLVSGTESNVAASPAAMAEFFVGGRDCKHKNVSPGDQRFLDRLPAAIQDAQQQQQQQPGQQKPFGASVTSSNLAGVAAGTPPFVWILLALFGFYAINQYVK